MLKGDITMDYKFIFNDKEYILNNETLEAFTNDEVNEVKGVDSELILSLMNDCKEIEFDKTYYNICCDNCKIGKEEKAKVFEYLEYHFYIYTKDLEYVISNISKEYEGQTFTRLERSGKVDNSFIVTVIVCSNCGNFVIEIEELEV